MLDLTVSPPRVLRPGMIHAASLAAVCGEVAGDRSVAGTEPLRSPGLLRKHYSPKAKLLVLNWKDDAELKQRDMRHGSPAACFIIAHTKIPAGFGAANVEI